MVDIVEMLASTPLFGEESKKDLGKLAKDVHDRTFAPGTALTDQGAFGSVFTLIAAGRATVRVDGAVVASLGPGEFFGEMALIDGSNRRSATVIADTDVRALMLTQPAFRAFAKSHPKTMWSLLRSSSRDFGRWRNDRAERALSRRVRARLCGVTAVYDAREAAPGL